MQVRARRVRNIGIATLVAGFLVPAVTPRRAAAECDVGICQGNPCTITGTHPIDNNCLLAFGDTDVTLAPRAALLYPDESSGRVTARNLTVQGTIRGKALSLEIDVTGNFRTEGRGRISDTRLKGIGEDVSIQAGGDVTLDGSTIKMTGDWAYLFVEAGGNLRVDSRIKVRGCQDDYANVELRAGGSITTTAAVSSRSCGSTAGSSMAMVATGDIIAGAPLALSGGRTSDFPVSVYIESGGSVTLGTVLLLSQLADSSVEVHAGADITLGGNVSAKAVMLGDGSGNQLSLQPGAAGIVRIVKRVNFSCGPATGVSGSITVSTGCYTDVTGANLAARPAGPISLGCSCIHPTGSNVCDGGCVGLDTATFDPAISTQLPPCS